MFIIKESISNLYEMASLNSESHSSELCSNDPTPIYTAEMDAEHDPICVALTHFEAGIREILEYFLNHPATLEIEEVHAQVLQTVDHLLDACWIASIDDVKRCVQRELNARLEDYDSPWREIVKDLWCQRWPVMQRWIEKFLQHSPKVKSTPPPCTMSK